MIASFGLHLLHSGGGEPSRFRQIFPLLKPCIVGPRHIHRPAQQLASWGAVHKQCCIIACHFIDHKFKGGLPYNSMEYIIVVIITILICMYC